MRRPLPVWVAPLAPSVILPYAVNTVSNTTPVWLKWFQVPLLLAAYALTVLVLAWEQRTPRGVGTPRAGRNPQTLEDAADRLATAVRQRWTDEATVRLLHRPGPLPVRWSLTRRPVAVPADDRHAARLRHGELSEVVDLFTGLPQRQLVVLGEPGAGKTVSAIMLTLGLLDHRREHGGPVPLLLPVTSWNPRTDHLATWIARRLLEEHHFVGEVDGHGLDAALRLVGDGHVLPVLDGLDEMPSALLPAAIAEIDRAAGDGPIVVTCRSTEYEEAVADGGTFLGRATVIELAPVPASEVVEYLSLSWPTVHRRWAPIFAHLRDHQGAPLARALSSPLMISMLRAAYDSSSTDPTELLDATRFADRSAIERYLLDAFVATRFHWRPPLPTTRKSRRARPLYRTEQARTALAFLARHMHELQTRHLAWWELHRTLGGRATRVAGALGAGAVTFLLAPTSDGLLRAIAALGTATLVAVVEPPESPMRVGLHGGPRPLRDAALAVAAALAFALVCFAFTGYTTFGRLLVMFSVAVGLTAASTLLLTHTADVAQSPDPGSVVRDDRNAAVVLVVMTEFIAGFTILGLAAPVGFSTESPLWDVAFTVPFMIGVPLAFHASWPWFRLATMWAALRGQLPWNFLRFLAEAQRVGVLRRSGAFYQFRHASLQDHLAGDVHLTTARLPAALRSTHMAHEVDVGPVISLIRARARSQPRDAVPVRRDVFARMTGPARRAVTMAAESARAAHCDHVGADHLVVGIIQNGAGVAARILSKIGLTHASLTGQPAAATLDGNPRAVPFDRQARAAITGALREALRLGDESVGTWHLLLAVLRISDTVTARALAHLNVERDRLVALRPADRDAEHHPR